MFRYLIRRILWAMLLFLVITFVTFVIFFMRPQDPARAQCGGDQASRSCLVLVTEKLGWTPIANYANFFGAPKGSGLPGGPWQWFYHLILPWCTFALLFAALYARMIRASVIETLDEDYVRTARAKGASERRLLFSHVLRNALLPVVTMLGMDVGVALGGAIFTESVYQLHGLGWTLVTAIGLSDFAVVQGVVVFATLAILSLNLLVDVLYAAIDPR